MGLAQAGRLREGLVKALGSRKENVQQVETTHSSPQPKWDKLHHHLHHPAGQNSCPIIQTIALTNIHYVPTMGQALCWIARTHGEQNQVKQACEDMHFCSLSERRRVTRNWLTYDIDP